MSRSAIREEQRGRSRGRKSRKRRLVLAGAILFAAIFIAGLVVSPGLFGNRNSELRGLNTGGPIKIAPDEGRGHVAPGVSHAPYNTRPATSGAHWATTPSSLAPHGAPARWGVYTEPLAEETLIHNLEHGGIGLHYDCPSGCPELVQALDDLVPGSGTLFILSPYPSMPKKIAVTAWRHLMYLDEFDREKILEFIREYQNRAPESVPTNPF